MAIGGGTWQKQDKSLPGVYVNVLASQSYIFEMGERGYVSMPLLLDWGIEGEIFEVTANDFRKKSTEIFGYAYTHEKMKGLRELFKHAHTLYTYRPLGVSNKATCTTAIAKYGGIRGNDLKINIVGIYGTNEELLQYKVQTLLDNTAVDIQIVDAGQTTTTSSLVNNDWVDWIENAELFEGTTPLTGGTNTSYTNDSYEDFLTKTQNYAFNILAINPEANPEQNNLFINFVKEMRDEFGFKFQLVTHNNLCSEAQDYEGIISIVNTVDDGSYNLIYWVAGASAGCELSKSLTNSVYDGEFSILANNTQADLEDFIKLGLFAFHKVGGKIRVLRDINTLKTLTENKNDDLKNNQIIRIIDQIATDITKLFVENYMGIMPNDTAGRIAFWNAIVKYLTNLQISRAVDEFDSQNVVVKQGDKKVAVVAELSIKPVSAMEQLYMNISII